MTPVEYVPFEPRTEGQRALKRELQQHLAAITMPPGHVLRAMYRRPLPRGADVENVLLYNIGGRGLSRAMRHGVRFEAAPAAPLLPAYEYDAVPPGGPFLHWREEAELIAFDRVRAASGKLAAVWWALRQLRTYDAVPPAGAAGPVGLRLQVTGPLEALGPDRVKGVIDGVVAAYEHMPPGLEPASLERYAAEIGAPAVAMRDALFDPAGAVLGANPRLLRDRWAPSDKRLMAAEVLYVRGDAWALSGSLMTLTAA
jgi:hypothetical protein